MPEKPDFTSWWNDRIFQNTGPYARLRAVYAELTMAGADPNHIKTLCSSLELGDLLSDLFFDMVARHRSQRPKKPHNSKRVALGQMKLGDVLALVAEADSLRTATADVLEEIDQTVTEMRERFKGWLVFPALEEFLLPHILRQYWSRGKKVDLWGTFFLLIVTEYLKGACGGPRYRMADKLLRANRRVFREAKLKRPRASYKPEVYSDGRCRVAGRICKLKSEHPNWAAVVDPIISRLNGKSIKNGKNSLDRRLEDCSLNRQSSVFRLFASECGRRGITVPEEMASKHLSPAVALSQRKLVTPNVK
jgi:hypothetical protein